MKKFKNKVALIIGASKGIGLKTAQQLAQQGAYVIITATSEQNLEIAKNSIPGEILGIKCDIANLSDLDNLYAEIHSKGLMLDILFANAGITKNIALKDITEFDFDNMVNVNYKGIFFAIQKALPLLNRCCSIILNASIAGQIAFNKHSLYSSTKAAIIHMAKLFAADLAEKNIRCNSVSPGYIKTTVWDPWQNSKIFQTFKDKIPLGNRFGSDEELANVVLFLASDDASYITGQNITVDGGFTTIFVTNDHE